MSKLLIATAILASLVAPASAAQSDVDAGVAAVLVYASKCPGGEAAVPLNAKRFIVVYNKTRSAHVLRASQQLITTVANAAGGDVDTAFNLWCHIMEPKVGPIFDNMSQFDF